jgi:hypothetical protein
VEDPETISSRSRLRRRRAGTVAMYNDVFLRLLLGALVTFAVIIGLAFVYLVPLGPRSERAVVSVVDLFIRRAAQGDALNARRLLSTDYLQSERVEEVDRLLRLPQRLYDYDRLANVDFRLLEPAQAGEGDAMASVHAAVRFHEGAPGTLDAVLVQENDSWRINDLVYAPPAGP